MLALCEYEGLVKDEEVLWTCVLEPGAADPARLAAIRAPFEKAGIGGIPKSPALAYHRAGQHAEATHYLVRYFDQQERFHFPLSGADLVWAALIWHRAGDKAEAETWRRRAAAWRDKQGKAAEWAERAEFDLAWKELDAARASEK
jgi:hypothetical protein